MSPELTSIASQLFWSCLFGLGIIFVLILGIVVVYLVIDTIRAGNQALPEHPWVQLARQHQLDFEPKTLHYRYYPLRIRGIYRTHSLKLERISNRSHRTRLTVQANQALTISSPAASSIHPTLTPAEVSQLLLPHGLPTSWRGAIWISPAGGDEVIYEQENWEEEIDYLQALFDIACDVVEGFPRLVALGGVTIPALTELATSDHPLQEIFITCLYRISQETKLRLEERACQLLCPNCLTHCAELPIGLNWWQQAIRLNWRKPTYFGCRQCGQSTQFLEIEGRQVVAVLDATETERISEQAGQLRVNWFIHSQPFDFDEVEIVRADDEAVERFAVQLGNDTDPVRRPRYRQMTCRVADGCNLSENTRRILENTFGQVEG